MEEQIFTIEEKFDIYETLLLFLVSFNDT